jgi:hypothetical protein
MNRRSLIPILCLVALAIASDAFAKRIKLYSYPKTIAPGQMGFLVLENPDPEVVLTQAKCTAEPLRSWVQSQLPILRIEQNGKQVWTSLGSYQTIGDSAIATFMAPLSLVEGPATIYIVNVRDASVPYNFSVTPKLEAKLDRLQSGAISPLGKFKLIGNGFMPTAIPDRAAAIQELEHNVGYSGLAKGEQYIRLAKRMGNDWDRLDQGNFLYITQNGKEWRVFVDECSITPTGMSLDFTAPPDIKPGKATIALGLRSGGKEVSRTAPLEVDIR